MRGFRPLLGLLAVAWAGVGVALVVLVAAWVGSVWLTLLAIAGLCLLSFLTALGLRRRHPEVDPEEVWRRLGG